MRLLALLGMESASETTARESLTPFESSAAFTIANPVDQFVLDDLNARGISPTYLCSDAVFVRRAFIDVIGTLPTANEAREFIRDMNPRKREALIEKLLQRDEFADYWALKWCDVLRVKSEFPINLWPNAVQAYHRWIRARMRDNTSYGDFARALLTSSGSNFRLPPANFYRAAQGRDTVAIARAVALTFMGTRIETWPKERQAELAAFFSRIQFKATSEWKEEIVLHNPAPAPALDAVFPDGSRAHIAPETDPREAFADWLITPENPWFAQAAVNRIWAWLMGRGIVHEPDDFRADNPPVNKNLLAYLARELTTSNFDVRRIYRLILTSSTYQQSSIPMVDHADAATCFACYSVRRLEAEVLIDALCALTGSTESYTSLIPEPFTYVPESNRTIQLADGSITSSFLELFGKPARDTGLASERNNEPSAEQRLYLLNSSDIQLRIEHSPKLAALMNSSAQKPAQFIRGAYLLALSRFPTEDETAAVMAYAMDGDMKPKDAAADLVWALINTKEFLYRH